MSSSSPAPSVREVRGRRVRAVDTLDAALRVHECLRDPLLDDRERLEVSMAIVLPDPRRFVSAFADDPVGAFADLLWDAFGIDATGAHRGEWEDPVLDWDEDLPRLKATVLAAYGTRWDDFLQIPYRDACSLVGMAPFETPMGQALHYRTAKRPRRTKHNAEELRAFDEAREFYRLGKGRAARPEAANERATAMFDALAGGR